MPEVAFGTLLDGRYKVLSRVGSGGMADVYVAEDQQLGRKVAVKLLHRRFAEDPDFVERFRREAQAAAGLQHPNVVSVYDRGAYDGTYYIAMEYLPGRSLKQLIRQEAPIDPVRAIDITVQILKAARFAHRRGVIHRDLKPHNVIVDDSGHVKVTDFGIARAGASDMTETGSIMGTAQYLSPEQAQGHAVSARSDLYSVGVVLYELLTGRVPFDSEAAVTIALKHVAESPVPPRTINPTVPPALEQVVLWAMNKNPADRPSDAEQFVAALEQARASIVAGRRGQHTSSFPAAGGVGAAAAAAAGLAAGAAGPAGASAPAAALATGAGAAGAAGGGGIGPYAAPLGFQSQSSAVGPTYGGYGGYPPERSYLDDSIPPDGTEPPQPPGRRHRRWPWLVAALVVLLLAGGGAAAYLLSRPATVTVPTVVPENVLIAQTQIQDAGLRSSVTYQTDNHVAGTVIRQDPLGGSAVARGSLVQLTVSGGPATTTVPDVEGKSEADAIAAINAAHLTVGGRRFQVSPKFSAGQAIGTEPKGGTKVALGSSVTLIASSGQPLVAVPDVIGQPEADARNTLQSDGLTVDSSTQPSTDVAPGDVVSQDPTGGTDVAPGSLVTLTIATKPPPTTATVPDVVGFSQAGATNALTQAGFNVTVKTQSTGKPNQDGNVLSQNPPGNATAKKGSTVTIVVGQYQQTSTTTSSSTATTTTKSTSTHTSTPTTSSASKQSQSHTPTSTTPSNNPTP